MAFSLPSDLNSIGHREGKFSHWKILEILYLGSASQAAKKCPLDRSRACVLNKMAVSCWPMSTIVLNLKSPKQPCILWTQSGSDFSCSVFFSRASCISRLMEKHLFRKPFGRHIQNILLGITRVIENSSFLNHIYYLSCCGHLGFCFFHERCEENLPVAVGFLKANCASTLFLQLLPQDMS